MSETPPARPPTNEARAERFMSLYNRHHRQLYLYVLALVGSPNHADDVLQDAYSVMWRKYDPGQAAPTFFTWASRVAYYEVLKYRRASSKDHLLLDDDVIQAVAQTHESIDEEFQRRREALQSCLKKLRPVDRDLIVKRYAPGATGREVARELGRPENAVYKSIGRIRRTLIECIQLQLRAERWT